MQNRESRGKLNDEIAETTTDARELIRKKYFRSVLRQLHLVLIAAEHGHWKRRAVKPG